MTSEAMKLDELADASGVAARTVRYYVQRGLLPAPAFRGKDTAYGREHLLRLKAIRRLQEQHLPLDVIQAQLAGASDEELAGIADGRAATTASGSAVTNDAAATSKATTRAVTRIAPGLELHLDANAPTESRVLAQQLIDLINHVKETL